jgi:hypothetical protein
VPGAPVALALVGADIAADHAFATDAASAQAAHDAQPTVAIPPPTSAVASFATRAIPLPQQLTLAPIAPRVASDMSKATDFGAALHAAAGTSSRRRRRAQNAFGVVVKLVVLAGVIFGGVYTVNRFVLTPKWQEDVLVFADVVAERRGLEWQEAVQVEVLPRDEYALQLASSLLAVSTTDASSLASEWRATGLAEGAFDLVAIGRAALPDQPAFYDAAAGRIYELEGLSPELRGIALSRSLTLALLDQHFDWGDASSGDLSVRLGVRALFEGDAVALQSETTLAALVDRIQVAAVSDEIGVLRLAAIDENVRVPPFALALAGATGEATSALFHPALSPLERNAVERVALTSDASVLDGSRARSWTPVDLAAPGAPSANATSADASAVGMMYWYYALAGRVGSDGAWAAAVNWHGDATTIERTITSFCVRSTIATGDQAGQWMMLQAFEQWAAAAPAGSNATVTPVGIDRLEVASCDPGVDADTIGSIDVRPFGGAPTELAVVGAMLADGLADTDEARACVVNSLRQGQVVTVTEPAGVDRSLTDATADLDSGDARMLMDTCGSF